MKTTRSVYAWKKSQTVNNLQPIRANWTNRKEDITKTQSLQNKPLLNEPN